MPRLLFATSNVHKADEVRAMLGPDWEVLDLSAFPELPVPEETGETFAANAAIKALAASGELSGLYVLADDSGLEVDALGGQPGVRSARYSGEGATDASNRLLLVQNLAGLTAGGPFSGRFRCAMALALDGKVVAESDGSVQGQLLTAERGGGGFGYDALFIPDGFDQTFGELPAATKNELSHRARALKDMQRWMATNIISDR
ncbi:MAG: non-canonical purine NTP pyrophosphatase [Verrucomicrobiaceae bacterium]|nr:non-canonical purine NTP pyrophosphatase [Verrucomicrobiaceae bacterium]